MTDESGPATTACAECGVAMTCNPGPDCWCVALPPQPMGAEDTGCLCPTCLVRRGDAALDAGHRLPAQRSAKRAAEAD